MLGALLMMNAILVQLLVWSNQPGSPERKDCPTSLVRSKSLRNPLFVFRVCLFPEPNPSCLGLSKPCPRLALNDV